MTSGCLILNFFILTVRQPPTSTLFPYTTLFRSDFGREQHGRESRRRRQGNRRPGRGRAARRASAGTLQGQGRALPGRAGPPQGRQDRSQVAMRTIHAPKGRAQLRYRRHLRVRQRVSGTAERPRLVVFRSLKHIYAQLVNDDLGVTLLGVGDSSEGVQVEGKGKIARGKAVGKLLAEKAKAAGVTRVVFDRAGYRYHGRVQAVADGAREGGLEF